MDAAPHMRCLAQQHAKAVAKAATSAAQRARGQRWLACPASVAQQRAKAMGEWAARKRGSLGLTHWCVVAWALRYDQSSDKGFVACWT